MNGTAAEPAVPPSGTVAAILRDIRFEQTLFSLPFALLATFLAAGGLPGGGTLLLILGALVTARSAAMAINRAADALFDARNPRTAGRAIPAGRVSRLAMSVFAAVMVGLFLACSAALNDLCLKLAPVALLFLVGYSWTKRLTPLCHVILGMTLGIAPAGAWVAVRGHYSPIGAELELGGWVLAPWLLGLAVACWVAGFDVLYACPDAEKDREEGLHSLPKRLGVVRAFRVSEILHAVAVALLAGVGVSTPQLGPAWWGGLALGAGLLIYEHRIVSPGRYERMATAFFRVNALFGAALLTAGLIDVLA